MKVLQDLRETMTVLENNMEYSQVYFFYKIGIAKYRHTIDGTRSFVIAHNGKDYEYRYDQRYAGLSLIIWG